MTNSRNKGASGEREVAQELARQLGFTFKRNLEQVREGLHGDLVCDDFPDFPFCIEVKRHAKGDSCLTAWEVQAQRAAEKAGKHPVVIYRFDHGAWRCRVWMEALAESVGGHAVCGVWADTCLQHFAWICREIMARRAGA